MLQAYKIIVLFFALSSVAYLGLAYSDNISGTFYAWGNRVEKVFGYAGVNMAALYVASTEPNMRYVAVREGMRKEEVAEVYQRKLGWSDVEKDSFAEIYRCTNDPIEGYLFPDSYIIAEDSSPDDVKAEMKKRFIDAITSTTDATDRVTPFDIDTVITVASLIQREAAGKRDMKMISGVIWNRLFKDMTLDIDATLQYVKGTRDNWWPRVTSDDKYLESAYNTYQNKGLPPGAIANPGIAAIAAAMNPDKTACLFYLHDRYGRIHCSRTYAEHKHNVNVYLK